MRAHRHGTKLADAAIYAALILIAAAAVFPVFFVFTNSFMGEKEIARSYGVALAGASTMKPHIIPEEFSLMGYINVFLLTPSYLMKFWNSVFVSLAIMAGQVFVSCLGGYGFAKFKFPAKNLIFYFAVILMMMPLQVTLVPNYMVFDKMKLIGSYAAVIVPGIFSTFGVFLIAQVFSSVPDNLIEAAKMDGANHFQILSKIMIPHCKAGVASLFVLNFIDNWNMVEQPLVFLKDAAKYPLSIFLANINQSRLGISFVCGVLAILPVFLLFLHLKDALVYGIENANLK